MCLHTGPRHGYSCPRSLQNEMSRNLLQPSQSSDTSPASPEESNGTWHLVPPATPAQPVPLAGVGTQCWYCRVFCSSTSSSR